MSPEERKIHNITLDSLSDKWNKTAIPRDFMALINQGLKRNIVQKYDLIPNNLNIFPSKISSNQRYW